MLFKTYQLLVKSFTGSGISKIPLIRQAHKKLVRSLAPEIVEVDGFRLRHLGNIPEENIWYVKALRDNVRPGFVVVDIGANIGFYTLHLSRLAGRDGVVYAFEPDKKTFEILKENVRLNDCKNVVLENMALSDKTGIAFMEKFGDNQKLSDVGVEIQSITFDDYFKDKKIDFIKMDAEGSEYKILKGMSQRPTMITEFYYKILDDPMSFFHDLQNSYTLFDVRNQIKRVIKDEFFFKYRDGGVTDLLCLQTTHGS